MSQGIRFHLRGQCISPRGNLQRVDEIALPSRVAFYSNARPVAPKTTRRDREQSTPASPSGLLCSRFFPTAPNISDVRQ